MLDLNTLLSELNSKGLNWDVLDEIKIRKQFIFKDFKHSIHFINKVAAIAESKNHHPDLHIFYNKVIIELWTHSVGGVTNNDIELASEIEKIDI
jgi:4a-hydroxytetrahydrobiopterin dehydratase